MAMMAITEHLVAAAGAAVPIPASGAMIRRAMVAAEAEPQDPAAKAEKLGREREAASLSMQRIQMSLS